MVLNSPALGVLILLTFAGCSHARGMRQEDGTIRVVQRASTSAGARDAAIDEAEDYCRERDLSPVFVKESGAKYTGKMDEETRDTIQKASTAALILGGMNSPVRDAGVVGHVYASGNDYEAEVIFRCK